MKRTFGHHLAFLQSSLRVPLMAASMACTFLTLSESSKGDWPGFLGPNGKSAVAGSNVPVEFAAAGDGKPAKNIAWHTPLTGRSVCGPILVGDKVFTTSSSGIEGRWLHVYALNAQSGEVVWERTSNSTGRPYCHPTSANAAPTPCSDGKYVYTFFSSNDLFCYDLDGNLKWSRGLSYDHPQAGNDVGMSSSPIVVDGTVIVTIECQADSFATGIDAATGVTKWEIARPRKANWSSPRLIVGKDGSKGVVLHGSDDLIALDPNTGSQLWKIDTKCSSIATAVVDAGRLHVPGSKTKAFELESAKKEPSLLWESIRVAPGSSSLVASPFGILGLKGSVLVCGDDKGEMRWQARLPEAGTFWSTPVIAGSHLFAFDITGKCFTVKLSESAGEVVGTSQLGEEVLGSPAVSGDALYVRSVSGLWKIAK